VTFCEVHLSLGWLDGSPGVSSLTADHRPNRSRTFKPLSCLSRIDLELNQAHSSLLAIEQQHYLPVLICIPSDPIMDPADLRPQSLEAKFLDVPYESRWECLKPVIIPLYMGKYGPGGKSMTMRQVADFMRDHYTFNAA